MAIDKKGDVMPLHTNACGGVVKMGDMCVVAKKGTLKQKSGYKWMVELQMLLIPQIGRQKWINFILLLLDIYTDFL